MGVWGCDFQTRNGAVFERRSFEKRKERCADFSSARLFDLFEERTTRTTRFPLLLLAWKWFCPGEQWGWRRVMRTTTTVMPERLSTFITPAKKKRLRHHKGRTRTDRPFLSIRTPGRKGTRTNSGERGYGSGLVWPCWWCRTVPCCFSCATLASTDPPTSLLQRWSVPRSWRFS